MESKSSWRRHCRQRRRLAWHQESKAWSSGLASAVFTAPDGVLTAVLPPSPGLVAAYLSYGTEPPTNQLITYLLATGHQVIVPAPGPNRQRLAWIEIKAGDLRNLTINIGHDPEILPGDGIAQAGCIFVPALAVDRSGTRLGQGGGWYDRMLAAANPEAPRVALVNPAELLPAGTLLRLPHDQAMTHVLLPSGLLALDASLTINLASPLPGVDLRA